MMVYVVFGLTEERAVRQGCCGRKRHRPAQVDMLETNHIRSKKSTVQSSTYTKDQDAPDNGGVLRRSDLVVCGTEEALLGATGIGKDNALLGRHGASLSR